MAMSMMAMRLADQSVDISSLSDKKKPKELECNSECALKERNRRLALALDIKNPDMRTKLQHPPYSDFLKYSAKQYPTFVAGVEKALSELVQKVEEGKLLKRNHSFPSMPMVQRKVIHELAEFYGCETQSYDQEPNKNVVATATKGKCWHPKESLTHLVQRELHPKAPPPIPLGSKEHEIRSSVQAVRQGTNVMGPAGWMTAKVPMARPSPVVSSSTGGSWASLVKMNPTAAAQPEPPAAPRSSFVSLSKSKHDREEQEKVIDYFDME